MDRLGFFFIVKVPPCRHEALQSHSQHSLIITHDGGDCYGINGAASAIRAHPQVWRGWAPAGRSGAQRGAPGRPGRPAGRPDPVLGWPKEGPDAVYMYIIKGPTPATELASQCNHLSVYGML